MRKQTLHISYLFRRTARSMQASTRSSTTTTMTIIHHQLDATVPAANFHRMKHAVRLQPTYRSFGLRDRRFICRGTQSITLAQRHSQLTDNVEVEVRPDDAMLVGGAALIDGVISMALLSLFVFARSHQRRALFRSLSHIV